MRQLVRVAVAVAVLLAVLGRPAPAAAETAEQCHATMHQFRASAGLSRASATSIPALGKAAANHAAYRVKVDTASVNYLALLGLPDLGLFGPDQTARLETPKLKDLGFTGVNPWDRTGRPSSPTAPGATSTRTSPPPPASRRPTSRASAAGSTPPTTACPCWTPTPTA